MIITPLSKLDAVNEIIGAMGEAPVDTLENSENVDTINAIRMLEAEMRAIQVMGWTFNTVDPFIMIPDDNSKHILWDDSILSIQFADNRVVRKRDEWLYDVTNNTDQFDAPLEAKVIQYVPFEEMPQVFRQYITVRTANHFVARYLGDPTIMQELQKEEAQAYMQMMEKEITLERSNIIQNPSVQIYMNRG